MIRSDGEIVFAGHSERYSKKKNDANICPELMTEFCEYPIDTIAYYERPLAQTTTQSCVRARRRLVKHHHPASSYAINWAHGYNIRPGRSKPTVITCAMRPQVSKPAHMIVPLVL
jgi:predicted NodU family carbamoyl transferase